MPITYYASRRSHPKMRETAFQILNRTIWTNNKAFKSKMRNDPNCERCGLIEMMEHARTMWMSPLCAAPMDQTRRSYHQILELNLERICPESWIHPTQHNPQCPPSVNTHSCMWQALGNILLMLTQEMKRDIVFRRLNLPPSARAVMDPQRLIAQLSSTLRRLHSYLQYIGLAKYAKATKMLREMIEINLEGPWGERLDPAPWFLSPPPPFYFLYHSWNHDLKNLSHANPKPSTRMHTQQHTVI